MNEQSQNLNKLRELIPDNQAQTLLIDLLQALPNIVAVLDEDRKLIFSNQALLDSVSITNFEDAFQLRCYHVVLLVESSDSIR